MFENGYIGLSVQKYAWILKIYRIKENDDSVVHTLYLINFSTKLTLILIEIEFFCILSDSY